MPGIQESVPDPRFMNSRIGLHRILEKAKTATMTTWNQEDLKSMKVPIPPKNIQQQLVSNLIDHKTSIDKLISEICEISKQEELLSQSILYKAFAGEL